MAKMTKEASIRIQKANASQNGGKTLKNSFVSRTQSAADKNANSNKSSKK